ncbi:MAG: hypothetical protein ACFFDI_30615 [Promethearchaeota archaeon]
MCSSPAAGEHAAGVNGPSAYSSAGTLGIPEGFGKPRQSELHNTAWLSNSRCIREFRREAKR